MLCDIIMFYDMARMNKSLNVQIDVMYTCG